MESEAIAQAVRQALQNDEALTTPGNCWLACHTLAELISRLDPKASVQILAHPGSFGENSHAALLINGSLVINPVPAALYPEFIGDISQAHPIFSEMEEL